MMATQTLETVPEETVAPAVTPSVDRVTSDVPKQTKPATAKNPGLVASGRRLAERNRLACEAKKQAEAQKTTTSTTNNTTNTTEQSSDNTGYLILEIGGLIVSGLSVYYQREAIMRTLGRSQKPQTNNQLQLNPTILWRNQNEKAESARWNNFKSYIYTL